MHRVNTTCDATLCSDNRMSFPMFVRTVLMVRFAMLVMMHRNQTQNAKNVLRVIVSLPANAYHAPTGTTRDAGDDKSGNNTVCDKCAENYFVSSEECTACPPGTTNAKGDNKTGTNTECDATLCSANEHVVFPCLHNLSSWYDDVEVIMHRV